MAPNLPLKEMPLYSHLRTATAAALIAFAGIIAVGVPALLPAALEQPLVASGLPWLAERRDARAIQVPFAAESTAEQSRVETQQAATQPEQPTSSDSIAWPELLRREVTLPEQATLMPPLAAAGPPAANPEAEAQPSVAEMSAAVANRAVEPQASAPEARVAHAAAEAQPSGAEPASAEPAMAAQGGTPVAKRRPTARPRPVAAKPAVEPQGRLAASKTPARATRTAKRSTNEALSAMRRFGDHLRDIPVSSYSADGTRRDIVIRPTSIQDVYYYSAPR
jgi:hypothetical protein